MSCEESSDITANDKKAASVSVMRKKCNHDVLCAGTHVTRYRELCGPLSGIYRDLFPLMVFGAKLVFGLINFFACTLIVYSFSMIFSRFCTIILLYSNNSILKCKKLKVEIVLEYEYYAELQE